MTISSGPAAPEIHQTIRQMFQDARRVLITSHIRPDGDAVGTLLGLGLALLQQGKDVRMVLADGVPLSFRHLKGAELVHRSAGKEGLTSYDLTITVDSSDLQRIGGVLQGREPDLNIDHHVTNPMFAKVNLVVESVATAAIVAEFLPAWGLAYNTPIAAALLTGIVTDTLGYRTSNMTPQALRLSAMLMEQGADLPDLYMRSLVSKTFEAARYWGMGLGKLHRVEVVPENNSEDRGKSNGDGSGYVKPPVFIWTSLTLRDREQAQYSGNDDADLVNVLSSIESDVAVIFVEQKDGRVKVSWRARPGYDVSKIALKFGGGGHPAAAGADIPGTLEAVQPQVLEATRAMLARTENQVI